VDGDLVILFAVAILFLLVFPALAIAAWVRVRNLERRGPGGAGEELLKKVGALENRLDALERKLAPTSPGPSASEVKPGVAPTPPPPGKPAAPPVAPAPPARFPVAAPAPPTPAPPAFDWEALIAGRWLNRIGILAILLATAFFLKLAYDNRWIGPGGFVSIGLLAGAALLVWSQFLVGGGYRYFGEGIAGLGGGVIFLSLYAAWDYYHLIPQGVAFAGMVVATAALGALAVRQNSQRVAGLALVGGFLTPMLLSTGQDRELELFTYLAVLNAGLLALARLRDWRALELVAFLWTQVYFWGWYGRFYHVSALPNVLLVTTAYATLFFALFATVPVIRSLRLDRLPGDQTTLVLLNAFLYLLQLHRLLAEDHRWALTVAVLALGAAHLGVANRLRAGSEVRLLYAGLALTFATLAIPIRLEGKWITIAWAIEGAVLIATGFRARRRGLRTAGLVLYALVAARLIAYGEGGGEFFWNARFAVYAAAIACYAAALWLAAQHKEQLGRDERNVYALVGIAANVLAVLALSQEFYDAYRHDALAQQLWLSLLWTVYATGLLLFGLRRGLAGLRWQALGLYGLTIGKVFLYDLSFLQRVYRIASFVVLGVVLLVVSFLYQRRLAAPREKNP
jgi:uncharacterized membrane protein